MKTVLDDTQVPQAHTDRSSQHASEPATLEAVGYEWRYAVLYARNDDDDDESAGQLQLPARRYVII